MTELEAAIVFLILEYQRNEAYRYEDCQMLHGLKYQKNMAGEVREKLRRTYSDNCFQTAYELKTYYMENGILSNTIVLKMRPKSPEGRDVPLIRIHSELDGTDHVYTHHAIEVFQEHGRYKVFDVLHSNKVVWLETYLDEVCRTNGCGHRQLRYDKGYLVAAHAYAENMQGLMDLMTYLDKEYRVGLPRMNFMNVEDRDAQFWLSDDVAMDFEKFGREFGMDMQTVVNLYHQIYDVLGCTQMELLKMLCYTRITQNTALYSRLEEKIFDAEALCQLVDLLLIS